MQDMEDSVTLTKHFVDVELVHTPRRYILGEFMLPLSPPTSGLKFVTAIESDSIAVSHCV